MRRPDPAFWSGRRVLLTGHTGFKGAWMTLMLDALGARVSGFALPPEPGPGAYQSIGAHLIGDQHFGDLRNTARVAQVVAAARPSVVLHLAAQALVGRGWRDPRGTFEVNVSGTVNLMEALARATFRTDACVVVTSDKVYRNDNSGRPFREDDPLGGSDPYSASKAGCEQVVQAWRHAYPGRMPTLVSARAGNVIGGGDFGEERLVPDLLRAEQADEPLLVRRPDATRPFQHVLDVLVGYLLLAEDAVRRSDVPRALNFGPDTPPLSVRALLDGYGTARGRPVDWRQHGGETYYEATRLGVDATLARRQLGWVPQYDTTRMLASTATWYEGWRDGHDMAAASLHEVRDVLGLEPGVTGRAADADHAHDHPDDRDAGAAPAPARGAPLAAAAQATRTPITAAATT